MNKDYLNVFVILIFSLHIYSEGVKFGLFQVLHVLKGGTMFMTCRVHESQNLNSDIKFVHKTQTDNTTVCECVQRGDTCNCNSTQSYICRCAAQTNKANSEYKDYTVYKDHSTENDTGVWFCGSDQLKVWSEPEIAVISTNPGLSVHSGTAVISQTFTFVCSVIKNIYKEDITFKRGEENICTCKYKTPTCETDRESTDNYRCKFVQTRNQTLHTGTRYLTTYSLTVSSFSVNDYKSWTCSTEKSNSNSITPTRHASETNTETSDTSSKTTVTSDKNNNDAPRYNKGHASETNTVTSDKDNNDTPRYNKDKKSSFPIVIVSCSVSGVIVVLGVVILTVCIVKRTKSKGSQAAAVHSHVEENEIMIDNELYFVSSSSSHYAVVATRFKLFSLSFVTCLRTGENNVVTESQYDVPVDNNSMATTTNTTQAESIDALYALPKKKNEWASTSGQTGSHLVEGDVSDLYSQVNKVKREPGNCGKAEMEDVSCLYTQVRKVNEKTKTQTEEQTDDVNNLYTEVKKVKK